MNKIYRTYYKLLPLVQTLPELIYNQDSVTSILTSMLQKVVPADFPSYISLVSVFARDLQDDFLKHFDNFLTLYVDLINVVCGAGSDPRKLGVPNAELLGSIVESISFIMKFLCSHLSQNPDLLRPYYGPLLGHSFVHVRELVAKAFTTVLRKVKTNVFIQHIQLVVKALVSNMKSSSSVDIMNIRVKFLNDICGIENDHIPHYDDDLICSLPKRFEDTIEGLSMMIFDCIKGVKGVLHSKGLEKLNGLVEVYQVVSVSINNALPEKGDWKEFSSGFPSSALKSIPLLYYRSTVFGKVLSYIFTALFRHLQDCNNLDIWKSLLESMSNTLALKNKIECVCDVPVELVESVDCILVQQIELLLFALRNYRRRALADTAVRNQIKNDLISLVVGLNSSIYKESHRYSSVHSRYLNARTIITFSEIWKIFHESKSLRVLSKELVGPILANSVFCLEVICDELMKSIPFMVFSQYFLPASIEALGVYSSRMSSEVWIPILYQIQCFLRDIRSSEKEIFYLLSGEGMNSNHEDNLSIFCNSIEAKNLLSKILSNYKSFANFRDFSSINVLEMKCIHWFVVVSSDSLTKDARKILVTMCSSFLASIERLNGLNISSFPLVNEIIQVIIQCIKAEIFCADKKKSIAQLISFVSKNLYENSSLSLSKSLLFLVKSYCDICNVSLSDFDWNVFLSDGEQNQLALSCSRMMLSGSYYLRINALSIMYFAKKLDRSEDMEEDSVNCVFLALEIASCAISLSSEREITRRLVTLEVLMRTNRMRQWERQLICGFAIGLLHIKFKPIWSLCNKILLAAVDGGSIDMVWSLLQVSLFRYSNMTSYPPCEGLDNSIKMTEFLIGCDDGLQSVTSSLACSFEFYYRMTEREDVFREGLVDADSRVDLETLFYGMWNALAICSSIVEEKSKAVVPFFTSFLKNQYYFSKETDVDVPLLQSIGLFSNLNTENSVNEISMSSTVLKKRLLSILNVFSIVSSPKQLFNGKQLFHYYILLLSKGEVNISKIALDCLLAYKPIFMVPYKSNISRLMDEKTIREEMITFDISVNGVIDKKHREDLIPIIIRICFGKIVSSIGSSKTSRDQSFARRSAVFTFLNNLDAQELSHLFHIMFKGLLPVEHLASIDLDLSPASVEQGKQHVTLTQYYSKYYEKVNNLIGSLTPSNMSAIAWQKQIGFLHTLEFVIKIMGFHVKGFLREMSHLISIMLTHAHIARREKLLNCDVEDVEDEDVEDSDVLENTPLGVAFDFTRSTKVRTLALLRLSEMINQFDGAFDYYFAIDDVLSNIEDLVESLPSSIINGSKIPALLRFLNSICCSKTVGVLMKHSSITRSLVRCIASSTHPDILRMVLESIQRLIVFENGVLLQTHLSDLIESYCYRFAGFPDSIHHPLKLCDIKLFVSGNMRLELRVLCDVANSILRNHDDVSVRNETMASLSTLLIGMLRYYSMTGKRKLDPEWAGTIMRIYVLLIPYVHSVDDHIPFISKIFGPQLVPNSLFYQPMIRQEMIGVFGSICAHPSTGGLLKESFAAIRDLNAADHSILGSRNYDRCMPVFKKLSEDVDNKNYEQHAWNQILLLDRSNISQQENYVVVYECLRCLYDDEHIIRAGALSSLKSLFTVIFNFAIFQDNQFCLTILMKVVIPSIRSGIRYSSDQVKRGFIMLFAQLVDVFGKSDLGNKFPAFFHPDLVEFLDEDPEKNLFENISHIQLHRRVRSLAKIKNLIGSESSPLSESTITNLFLPLCLHFLFCEEFLKRDHQPIMQEGASLLGVISTRIGWSMYLSLLKTILRKLGKCNQEKEPFLIQSLCNVLGGFHFDLSDTSDSTMLVDDVQNDNAEDNLSDQEEDKGDNEEENRDDNKLEGNEVDDDDIVENETTDKNLSSQLSNNNSVNLAQKISSTLVDSIMPWVKVFLLKNVEDHEGKKGKVVRPQVAVAMVKLTQHLCEPFVSNSKKESLFSNVLIAVVDTLRNRDSSSRDIARESLVRIIETLGLESLKKVIYEMQHLLIEGYQRHVCNYSIRYLLHHLLGSYVPDISAPRVPFNTEEITDSSHLKDIAMEYSSKRFDLSIPLIAESIIDDLVGVTQNDRDVTDAKRSLIREAKGVKAVDILEFCGKYLLFRPAYALLLPSKPHSLSSVHAITIPLLSVLSKDENPQIVGRIGEGLQRFAFGLSQNESLIPQEMLLFLHATLFPYIKAMLHDFERHRKAIGKINSTSSTSIDEIDEHYFESLPSYLLEEAEEEEEELRVISGSSSSKKETARKRGDDVTGFKAKSWLPNERQAKRSFKEAIEERNRQAEKEKEILVGRNAPKMTGFDRYKKSKERTGRSLQVRFVDVIAVNFCLTLFHSGLKSGLFKSDDDEIRSMIAPFLPLLSTCLHIPNASNVVSLAMKCLSILLAWELPVTNFSSSIDFSQMIGNRMLKLMFQGGVLVTSDNELVQSCLKGLTSLFQHFVKSGKEQNEKDLPLKIEKIRYLVQLLMSSMNDATSSYQTAIYQLLRSIVETRIMIPEIYDLMIKLTEQIVLPHRQNIRDSASNLIVNFIVNYPLGDKRMMAQVKQLLVNCSYEFEEGRMSALGTVETLVKALPGAAVDEFAQMIFLSLVLRVVNDSSSSCRSKASDVIVTMVRKINSDLVMDMLEYSYQWMSLDFFASSDNCQTLTLVKTGIQATTILLKARPDLIKKSNRFAEFISLSHQNLVSFLLLSGEFHPEKAFRRGSIEKREQSIAGMREGEGDSGGSQYWSLIYHMLCFVEMLWKNLSSSIDFYFCNPVEFSSSFCQVINQRFGLHLSTKSSMEIQYLYLEIILECLLYPHAWIRSISCRILKNYLDRRDVDNNRLFTTGTEYLLQANALYSIGRRLCVVLNQPNLFSDLLESLSSCMVFTIKALFNNPQLVNLTKEEEDRKEEEEEEEEEIHDNNNHENEEDDEEEEENAESGEEEDHTAIDVDDTNETNDGDVEDDTSIISHSNDNQHPNEKVVGSSWIMQRLRAIGVDTRGERRLNVMMVSDVFFFLLFANGMFLIFESRSICYLSNKPLQNY